MEYKACNYLSRIGLLCLFCSATTWADDDTAVSVIEPDKGIAEAKPAAIDSERFELGMYLGSLSVEDFGSDLVSGVELNYHLTPDWMLQVNYGKATIDRAAFESGQLNFLADEDRDFEYYSIAGGYRLLRGRSFFGARNKYDSDIYVFMGPDHVSFADNSEWGLAFALSYRLVLTDWMTANVDFREHLFERTFIGDRKQTLNTEFRIGFNVLF